MKLKSSPNTSLILLVLALAIPTIKLVAAEECIKGKEVDASFEGSNWPDLWRMTSSNPDDPQQLNNTTAVDPEVLVAAGVSYQYIDPSSFEYPSKAVPWEPTNASAADYDPIIANIREASNYSYADIITVTAKIDKFWTEHLHGYSTIRYIIDGSGFFDLRDANDQWVRMHVKAGDFMEWPAGIYHRFVVDEGNFITAMRLFKGDPVWTSYDRSDLSPENSNVTTHSTRQDYINKFLCGTDPDALNESNGNNDSIREDDETPKDNKTPKVDNTQSSSSYLKPNSISIIMILLSCIILG